MPEFEEFAEDDFFQHIDTMLEESIGESRAENFFRYVKENDWEEVLREYVLIAAGFSAARVLMKERIEAMD